MDVHAVRQEHGRVRVDGLRLLDVERGGDVDDVDLAVEQLGKRDALFLGKAALDLLRAAHAVLDEEALAAALADAVDDHERELGAVFDGAAVLVRAGVVERGGELVEQPAVAAVQERHVVAGRFE